MRQELRKYQVDAREALRAALAVHRRAVLVLPTGCHAPGTGVLLADGRVRAVESVRCGDLLMGPDGTPREVTELHRGDGPRVTIVPKKGQPWVVNPDHVLTVVSSGTDEVLDLTVREWAASGAKFRHHSKLFRPSATEFVGPRPELPIDPWFLGLLLADGSLQKGVVVTKPDAEVLEACEEQAALWGLSVNSYEEGTTSVRRHLSSGLTRKGSNPLWNEIVRLGLAGKNCFDKFVPSLYLRASIGDRRKLLAGMIDGDGCANGAGYSWSTVSEVMARGFVFLARSLGFAAYAATRHQSGCAVCWRVGVDGDLSDLPVRLPRRRVPPRRHWKDHRRIGFSLGPASDGPWFGFSVTGDHRYLLSDYTVVHNSGKTTVACDLIERVVAKTGSRPNAVLFVAHRQTLVDQCSERLDENGLTGHGVLMSSHPRKRPFAPIQVGSVQTLVRRKPLDPAPILVVIDESHHVTPDSVYSTVLEACPEAWVVGLTATPWRLDGTGLGRFFGAMATGPTYAELTAEGHLVPPKCWALGVPSLDDVKVVGGDWDAKGLSKAMGHGVKDLVTWWRKAATGKRTVTFACDVEHSRAIVAAYVEAGVPAEHLDGESPWESRKEVLGRLKSGETVLVSNCGLFGEGFDLPSVECVQLARPTKSLSLFLQQCLDAETQILCGRGWLGPDDLLDSDLVASVDVSDRSLRTTWSPVLSRVDRPLGDGEEMYAVSTPSVDIRVTGGHALIAHGRGDRRLGASDVPWGRVSAEQLATVRSAYYIPVAGMEESDGVPLTDDELRFLGWFMSDGTLNRRTGSIAITQALHQPHFGEIEKCLRGCGFKFGTYLKDPRMHEGRGSEGGRMQCVFNVSKGLPRGRDRHLSGWGRLEPWVDKNFPEALMSVDSRQLAVLLEALHLGDGSKHAKAPWTRRSYHIINQRPTFIDRLQSLCVRRGWRCNSSVTTGAVGGQRWLHIKPTMQRMVGGTGEKDRGHLGRVCATAGERVWCVETVHGTLVVRRHGKVAIVGNCGRGARPSPGKAHFVLLDHAGNLLRHGWPTQDREWSLEDRPKEPSEEGPAVKACPQCFYVLAAAARACPECGFVFVAEKKERVEETGLPMREVMPGDYDSWLRGRGFRPVERVPGRMLR